MLQNVIQGKIPSVQQCTRALTAAQISAACFDILDVFIYSVQITTMHIVGSL